MNTLSHLVEQFERLVAVILIFIISIIVAISVYRVADTAYNALVIGHEDPLSYAFFQKTFGQIMTVLIAIEFNQSIVQIVRRIENIFQIKIVLLIAMLALTRKFIILDINNISFEKMLGLAAIMLTLGIVYRLVSYNPHNL